MKYRKITVIGIGTLGGFLTQYLSDSEFIDEINIIDYDKVEDKNIKKSIYSNNHIGMYKTDALKEILNFKNVKINNYNFEYCEQNNKFLPVSDLIIDCRDIICNRGNDIDIRLYISSKNLIIDCRKNVSYDYITEGNYNLFLTKTEIRNASYIASNFILTQDISKFIHQGLIQNIDINYLISHLEGKSSIQKNHLLIDDSDSTKRILNIDQYLDDVLEVNKTYPIQTCLGSVTNNPLFLNTIKEHSLINFNDIMNNLTSIVNTPIMKNHCFVVSLKQIQNNYYLEFFQETGAA